MVKLLVLVEGDTEERFVKNLLAPHLSKYNVFITPSILRTKNNSAGSPNKGGVTSYSKFKADMSRLLKDTSSAKVTSMIDLYGLPDDFPGYTESLSYADCYQRVGYLEQQLKQDIGSEKLLPYIQLHEFEALCFSDITKFDKIFVQHNKRAELEAIVSEFNNSPEMINNSPKTAPSKRLKSIFPDYQKTTDGIKLAQEIGLMAIRAKCPHFDNWVQQLESFC